METDSFPRVLYLDGDSSKGDVLAIEFCRGLRLAGIYPSESHDDGSDSLPAVTVREDD